MEIRSDINRSLTYTGTKDNFVVNVNDIRNAIRGFKCGKSDANGRLSSCHFILHVRNCLFICHLCFLRYLYMVMYPPTYWCPD